MVFTFGWPLLVPPRAFPCRFPVPPGSLWRGFRPPAYSYPRPAFRVSSRGFWGLLKVTFNCELWATAVANWSSRLNLTFNRKFPCEIVEGAGEPPHATDHEGMAWNGKEACCTWVDLFDAHRSEVYGRGTRHANIFISNVGRAPHPTPSQGEVRIWMLFVPRRRIRVVLCQLTSDIPQGTNFEVFTVVFRRIVCLLDVRHAMKLWRRTPSNLFHRPGDLLTTRFDHDGYTIT